MKNILITNWISKIALLLACSVALSSFVYSQTQTDLDFSFIPNNTNSATGNFTDSATGIPFSLTVTSDNRAFINHSTGFPASMIALRGVGTSRVTLSFSRNISNFTLNTFDFDSGFESMANFSILPDFVDSSFNFDSINNTVQPIGANATGEISWFSLPPGTRDISFDFISNNSGLFVGFSGSLIVPEPATTAFLGFSVLGFIVRRKRT